MLGHKWLVLYYGLKRGVPLWQLLIHDWSKFTPTEWSGYVNFFFRGDIPVKGSDRHLAFKKAWKHHWMNNPHHWEYWSEGPGALHVGTDGLGGKVLSPALIPENYLLEMLADWDAVGYAKGNPSKDFYLAKKDEMVLHSETRSQIAWHFLHD